MNEHESITELSYRALTDAELLATKYLTIEEVIDYLKDDSNFKSLAEQLKETMIKNYPHSFLLYLQQYYDY